MSAATRTCLLVGSSGVLGRAYPRVINSMGIIGLDPSPPSADSPILKHLPLAGSPDDSELLAPIDTIISESGKVQAIIHCAGSWAGGPFPSPTSPSSSFFEYLSSTTSMLNTNLSSAVFAAGLASRYLDSDGGHLILTGAKAAFKLTDCSGFMPGYGLSKMGVMNLAEMLRCEVDFKVSVIHPGTIDTPNNRAAMPDADFGEWHSVDGIAEGVKGIIEKGEGGDYTVETEGGKTWLEKI